MPEKKCRECGNSIPEIRTRVGSTLHRVYCNENCEKRYRHQQLGNGKRKQRNPLAKSHWDDTKSNPLKLAKHMKRTLEYRKTTRDWLNAYKMQRGCVDCGYNDYFCALQLDHEGPKSISISNARSSIARLQKEIEDGKCVVRCANCHAIVTWKRKVGLL